VQNKDGAKRRRLRRWPKAILDFKFSLRLPSSMRFKGDSARRPVDCIIIGEGG